VKRSPSYGPGSRREPLRPRAFPRWPRPFVLLCWAAALGAALPASGINSEQLDILQQVYCETHRAGEARLPPGLVMALIAVERRFDRWAGADDLGFPKAAARR
jgi:hypothetical protein